ncbi:hypothetical protein V1527DRAFT_510982 [Lipomyces starkeyi]
MGVPRTNRQGYNAFMVYTTGDAKKNWIKIKPCTATIYSQLECKRDYRGMILTFRRVKPSLEQNGTLMHWRIREVESISDSPAAWVQAIRSPSIRSAGTPVHEKELRVANAGSTPGVVDSARKRRAVGKRSPRKKENRDDFCETCSSLYSVHTSVPVS